MPAFRFSRRGESQIDPFNAGEPILPWDDPDALADEGDVSRSKERICLEAS